MIKLNQITKSFQTADTTHLILDRLTLELPDQTLTTIFGPNGCGKTTLLNILAGLDQNFQGQIEGLNLTEHKLGYVFQDYRRSLLPWATVRENILFPLKLQKLSHAEQSLRLNKLLATLPFSLELNQRVHALSGGQAQLVCILRAIIINPEILILDEPFAALDYERTLTLRKLISNLAKALKLKVLFISHDLEEALFLGDQVVFLSKRPTQVVEILQVDLPYPRSASILISPEFNVLKQKALSIFERCCLTEK